MPELEKRKFGHGVHKVRTLTTQSSDTVSYEQGKNKGKNTTPDGVVACAREARPVAADPPPALDTWEPSDVVLDTVRSQRGQWDIPDEAIRRMVQPWRLYAAGRNLPPAKWPHSFVEYARRERVTETEINARMQRAEESHGPRTNDDIARQIARANGLDV